MQHYRVVWAAVDHMKLPHTYSSHDMSKSDADAMAATIRAGQVSDVAVVPSGA